VAADGSYVSPKIDPTIVEHVINEIRSSH
jgi:hypothetical protein